MFKYYDLNIFISYIKEILFTINNKFLSTNFLNLKGE